MKIVAAAVQMPAELSRRTTNLERADAFLVEANRVGAELVVLPEMFNTGYGLLPDFGPHAEGVDGPTVRHLARRSHQWRMDIAAGFVERDGRHLYDSLAFCVPGGPVSIYRKRRLVFWEAFRFRPGRTPLVVPTRWGRIGLAVCADMMDRRTWDDYRGRIDLAVVASAWPELTCRLSNRKHWLFGHVGPMAAEIPAAVARDLGIPVIFANQCGNTRTTIPILGPGMAIHIADRFAGCSSISDGRHSPPVVAGTEPQLVLSEVPTQEPRGLCS